MSKFSYSLKALCLLLFFVPLYAFLSYFFPDIINLVMFNPVTKRWFDITACTLAISLIVVLRYVGFDWLSAPNVLLVYIWLFHFGSSFFTSIDPKFWKTFPWGEQWTLVRSWQEALVYSSLCCIAFVIGA